MLVKAKYRYSVLAFTKYYGTATTKKCDWDIPSYATSLISLALQRALHTETKSLLVKKTRATPSSSWITSSTESSPLAGRVKCIFPRTALTSSPSLHKISSAPLWSRLNVATMGGTVRFILAHTVSWPSNQALGFFSAAAAIHSVLAGWTLSTLHIHILVKKNNGGGDIINSLLCGEVYWCHPPAVEPFGINEEPNLSCYF